MTRYPIGKQTLLLCVVLVKYQLKVKKENIFFHDGTERRIQRPKDRHTQKVSYSGKKKCHTAKNNLIINEDCKVALLTPSFEGRHHDKHIADRVGYCVPQGSTLSQDTGFQGFVLPDINIIQL
ncbi:hypothetical protein C6501_10920 [Candidatus Poribacteria bacterium]|nr:MAG: hypothetical protein C6501_10920 [Candidatus Poribacteria bacterium]